MDEPQIEPKSKYIDRLYPGTISLALRRAAPWTSAKSWASVPGLPFCLELRYLFLPCILNHSGEAESLVYDTLRAGALSLSYFFPNIHFLIPQKWALAFEHPSYDTMWQAGRC